MRQINIVNSFAQTIKTQLSATRPDSRFRQLYGYSGIHVLRAPARINHSVSEGAVMVSTPGDGLSPIGI